MKAFFTSLGRHASASATASDARNRDEIVAPSLEPHNAVKSSFAVPRPKQGRSVTQTSFRSLDSSVRDIGHMPSTRASSVEHAPLSSSNTAPSISVWTSNVSQSLKSSISMRKKDRVKGRTPDLGQHPPSSFSADGQRQYSNEIASRPSSITPGETRPPATSASDDLDPRLSRLSLAKLKYPSSSSRSGLRGTCDPANGSSSRMQEAPPSGLDAGKRMSMMDSAELANRLNELAVANADGLLDEDEYRTLRAAVFDRLMRADGSTMDISDVSNRSGIRSPISMQPNAAADSDSRSSWEYLEQTPDGSHPSASNGVSKHTRRGSIAALSMPRPFSRESYKSDSDEIVRSSRTHLDRRSSFGASSLLSNGEEGSRKPMSMSSTAMSGQVSHVGRIRSGSQVRRAQAELAAKDMERSLAAERTARSLRAVSIHDSHADTFTKSDKDKGREGLASARAEIGASSMFGSEYADRNTAEIKAEMAVVKKEGDSLLDTFALTEESLLLKHSKVDAAYMRRALANKSYSDWHTGAKETSRPPSSYSGRRNFSPLQSIDTNKADGKPPEVIAFEQELADINAKRDAVVKRYQDRLSYLQSKLRSAGIREGLKSH